MWITMQSLEHHDYDSSCPENHGVHFKLDCLRDFVENWQVSPHLEDDPRT